MTETSRFPAALRTSAVARWSHRDPIEGGNPFPADDSRARAWATATEKALEALTRFDAGLTRDESVSTDAAVYRDRVIGLAEARFDVWARRLATVVRCNTERLDVARWLGQYVDNWLVYVSETCPHVEIGDDLEVRLRERARYWTDQLGT